MWTLAGHARSKHCHQLLPSHAYRFSYAWAMPEQPPAIPKTCCGEKRRWCPTWDPAAPTRRANDLIQRGDEAELQPAAEVEPVDRLAEEVIRTSGRSRRPGRPDAQLRHGSDPHLLHDPGAVTLAVFSVMSSSAAICLCSMPVTTRAKTSVSRAVSRLTRSRTSPVWRSSSRSLTCFVTARSMASSLSPAKARGDPHDVSRGAANPTAGRTLEFEWAHEPQPGTVFAPRFGMALFPDIVIPAPYRLKAQRDLRRVSLDLEYERRRASILKRAAATNPALALKASAAEVRVAVLQARAAQLRRSAGRPAA